MLIKDLSFSKNKNKKLHRPNISTWLSVLSLAVSFAALYSSKAQFLQSEQESRPFISFAKIIDDKEAVDSKPLLICKAMFTNYGKLPGRMIARRILKEHSSQPASPGFGKMRLYSFRQSEENLIFGPGELPFDFGFSLTAPEIHKAKLGYETFVIFEIDYEDTLSERKSCHTFAEALEFHLNKNQETEWNVRKSTDFECEPSNNPAQTVRRMAYRSLLDSELRSVSPVISIVEKEDS